MPAQTRRYDGVSRAIFESLRGSLAKFSVPMPPGDAGTIQSNGMTGSFRYDQTAESLELTIEKAPIFVPKPMIWKAIDSAVAGAKETRA